MFKHALIMAAGRGSRMIPLTNMVPKAMAPLANTTLIGNGIRKIANDIESIHVTVGYKGDLLASHVINEKVSSVFNTTGKGNSWWIYNSLMRYLNEPVLVLTCDNVIDLDYNLLYDEYISLGEPADLLIPVKPIEGLEGDFIFHKNQKVTDLSRKNKSDIYCSGIQVVNPRKINDITFETDDFGNLWSQLMDKGELMCSHIYPKNWYTVDTLEQLTNINLSIDNK